MLWCQQVVLFPKCKKPQVGSWDQHPPGPGREGGADGWEQAGSLRRRFRGPVGLRGLLGSSPGLGLLGLLV